MVTSRSGTTGRLLAGRWQALNAAEREEALKLAGDLGAAAGKLSFTLIAKLRRARPDDYVTGVVNPLYIAGAMLTVWRDRWQLMCSRETDNRIESFMSAWNRAQQEESAGPTATTPLDSA